MDTRYKDEGIGKRLKKHAGASQIPGEREEKEGGQNQKGKRTDVHLHCTQNSGKDKKHAIDNKPWAIFC